MCHCIHHKSLRLHPQTWLQTQEALQKQQKLSKYQNYQITSRKLNSLRLRTILKIWLRYPQIMSPVESRKRQYDSESSSFTSTISSRPLLHSLMQPSQLQLKNTSSLLHVSIIATLCLCSYLRCLFRISTLSASPNSNNSSL